MILFSQMVAHQILLYIINFLVKIKVKQFLDWPWGFQMFEAPRISRQSAHEGGKVVSPTHRPALLQYCWYSFLLEAESTPGPQCGRKDYVNKNSNETFGNRTRDLPVFRVVPQLTATSRALAKKAVFFLNVTVRIITNDAYISECSS